MADTLASRRAEFDRLLWDHAADEFQAQFDERRELTAAELKFLAEVHARVIDPDEEAGLVWLRAALREDETRVDLLLQTCGLTRSKIITDLKASASAAGLKIPSSYRRIAATTGWEIAGPYLLNRLRAVFGRFDGTGAAVEQVFQALNQATWPGYIRQQRAKLSGHEAEYRVAVLLSSLEVPFTPEEKASNPLCRDAQLGGMSFDLVLPSLERPLVLVMCTVHTANIGQYGESKTKGDIAQVRGWLETASFAAGKPTLVAVADGVGFHSNRAGLDGVLTSADEFCQFKTLWKAVVIAAKCLDEPLRVALPAAAITAFADFIDRWDARDMIVDLDGLNTRVGWLQAGDGLVTRTA